MAALSLNCRQTSTISPVEKLSPVTSKATSSTSITVTFFAPGWRAIGICTLMDLKVFAAVSATENDMNCGYTSLRLPAIIYWFLRRFLRGKNCPVTGSLGNLTGRFLAVAGKARVLRRKGGCLAPRSLGS